MRRTDISPAGGLFRRARDVAEACFEAETETESEAERWTRADAEACAEALLQEYRELGFLRSLLPREVLALPSLVGASFFERLAASLGLPAARPKSPVAEEPDDGWMARASYCFVNVRATASEPRKTGSFASASRLLPLLRVNALHLAPFFESVHGIVYCQTSFTAIADDVTHLGWERCGLDRHDQLRYLIDCCHLLGMSAGVDLTPHTAQFSRQCVCEPELFRWVRLAPDRRQLADGMTQDDQYRHDAQQHMARRVREITTKILASHGLATLEDRGVPPQLGRQLLSLVVESVAAEGYYPVAPQTWNGVGAPAFRDYDASHGEPRWDYRDLAGHDQEIHNLRLHASFLLHQDMRANRPPAALSGSPHDWHPETHHAALDYLAAFFPRMHAEYGFDFLRLDYIDHTFDHACETAGGVLAIGEHLLPQEVRVIAERARACFPAAGVLADHLGHDLERYREAGVTLILGGEVASPMTADTLRRMLAFNAESHRHRGAGGAVTFPIDTHDIAHPLFLGRELAEREGPAGIQLRHFLSRFGSGGVVPRPKYEVMGNQDGSTGIHRVNNHAESLAWGSDRLLFDAYHAIEDTYARLAAELCTRELAGFLVEEGCAAWVLAPPRATHATHATHATQMIVAVASLRAPAPDTQVRRELTLRVRCPDRLSQGSQWQGRPELVAQLPGGPPELCGGPPPEVQVSGDTIEIRCSEGTLAVIALEGVERAGTDRAGTATLRWLRKRAPVATTRGVIVQLFDWPFRDIERALPELVEMGYGYVQISPPQKSNPAPEWWGRYQPIDHTKIEGPLGDAGDLGSLARAALDPAHPMKLIVDAVLNHMAAWGEEARTLRFPRFAPEHFHPQAVIDYNHLESIRTGWCGYNSDLPDLNTKLPHVRAEARRYLDMLIREFGVHGFRFDAVKHIEPEFFAEVCRDLPPESLRYGEYIYQPGHRMIMEEYLPHMKLFDFLLLTTMTEALSPGGHASMLVAPDGTGRALRGADAITFVKNHDMVLNQYGGYVVDESIERLLYAYVLGRDQGTPCVYVDRHDDPFVLAAVRFHNLALGKPAIWRIVERDVLGWQRGTDALIVLNKADRATGCGPIWTTLEDGVYTDLATGDQHAIARDGMVTLELPERSAAMLVKR